MGKAKPAPKGLEGFGDNSKYVPTEGDDRDDDFDEPIVYAAVQKGGPPSEEKPQPTKAAVIHRHVPVADYSDLTKAHLRAEGIANSLANLLNLGLKLKRTRKWCYVATGVAIVATLWAVFATILTVLIYVRK